MSKDLPTASAALTTLFCSLRDLVASVPGKAWTTAEVTSHMGYETGDQILFHHLLAMAETQGWLEKRKDCTDGKNYWSVI